MKQSAKTALIFAVSALMLASIAGCASKPKPTSSPLATGPVASNPESTPSQGPVSTASAGIRPGSVQDFVINVGDRVYFDTDHSDIRADARPVLDAQAAWLARYPQVKIRIEGNADERGTREYNFALGARRAQAALEYLVSRGVVPGRISTISYGKEQPLDSGSGEDAWAKNRNDHTAITEGAL